MDISAEWNRFLAGAGVRSTLSAAWCISVWAAQSCVGVPLARLVSFSSCLWLVRWKTGGKLALTSLWVRVSKCCSHYKRPRDDCGNKVAEKIFRAAFHKFALEPGRQKLRWYFNFLHSLVQKWLGLCFRTLEQQGETRSVWSRNQNQAGCQQQHFFPLFVSLLMKFFFHHSKTFFIVCTLNPHRWRVWVESVQSVLSGDLTVLTNTLNRYWTAIHLPCCCGGLKPGHIEVFHFY